MKSHTNADQHQPSKPTRPHSKSILTRTGNGEKTIARHIGVLSLTSNPTQDMISTAIAVLKHDLKLTPRQAEVLYWMAEGKTNEEISIILQCSFFTIKAHAKAIFRLLQVESRTAAAGFAHRAYADQVKH